ncbi:hypothetical protein AAFF_G00049180 [Aldrovandia affinis]|uniref:Uncharacterized protein n=1 Tax=Aldrovandia affinis TaxID=143900 RepID=A0AAD7S1D7_9TELE|nr:hypothetical protein AAFF_G00049180 [Aldrovandia affinis]
MTDGPRLDSAPGALAGVSRVGTPQPAGGETSRDGVKGHYFHTSPPAAGLKRPDPGVRVQRRGRDVARMPSHSALGGQGRVSVSAPFVKV